MDNNDVLIQQISLHFIKTFAFDVLKRFFDIILAIIGLVVLLPIIVVVKIAYIMHKDFNPIIFSQYRIGKNGKKFKFYKFRSMVPNADDILEQTLKIDKIRNEEYKVNKKLKNDPRITSVGKFLRKSSLDELPQLINILKGDMSFIGNRPYLPREKEDMMPEYYDIVKTKPGLTGYWQVSGRSDVTFRRRLELESYYSNNRSLKLDVYIFFKTFKVVFFKNGAK